MASADFGSSDGSENALQDQFSEEQVTLFQLLCDFAS